MRERKRRRICRLIGWKKGEEFQMLMDDEIRKLRGRDRQGEV